MQVLNFTIPVSDANNIIVQQDEAKHFYPHLHRHAEAQLTWVIAGEGILVVNNKMHAFKSNSVFFIGANQQHLFKSDAVYFKKNSSRKVKATTIFFNPNGEIKSLFDLTELHSLANFISEFEAGFVVPSNQVGKVSSYITEMAKYSAAKRLIVFMECFLYLRTNRKSLLPFATQAGGQKVSDADGQRMAKIYKYVFDNFDKQISLDDVAKVANFTVPAFCRFIKKRTQKTFITFLNEVRINEACKLLANENLDGIAAVAYRTGFNSAVHFNRVFKGIVKQTPKEYISALSSSLNY